MLCKDVNVILKLNGDVYKNVVNYSFNKGMYLKSSEDCFTNYIDYSEVIKKEKDIEKIFLAIKNMLLALGYDTINPVFELMMIDNNFNNIVPLINSLLKLYGDLCFSTDKVPNEICDYVDVSNYEEMLVALKKYPNMFYRIIIKSIMRYHYSCKLNKMHIYDSRILYDYFLLNGSVYELFKKLNEPFYSIANGGMPKVALSVLSTELERNSEKIYSHLCWDVCPVNTCVNCPKIKSRQKLNIDYYDFIVSGYQTSLGNGKTVVTDCKRLTLDNPNKH